MYLQVCTCHMKQGNPEWSERMIEVCVRHPIFFQTWDYPPSKYAPPPSLPSALPLIPSLIWENCSKFILQFCYLSESWYNHTQNNKSRKLQISVNLTVMGDRHKNTHTSGILSYMYYTIWLWWGIDTRTRTHLASHHICITPLDCDGG